MTVFQFAEGLSDRRAADAVRGRIDWKYALGLALDDPGFDASVLCEFRAPPARRLGRAAAARRAPGALPRARLAQGPRPAAHRLDPRPGPRPRPRPPGVRREALRHALNSLAAAAPEWLRRPATPEWVERYGRRPDESRLPDSEEGRRAWPAGRRGRPRAAGRGLRPRGPAVAGAVPAVETLRRVWVQQFLPRRGGLRWRTEADGIPPAAALDQLAARRRGALRQEGDDDLDRLQGPPDRDLRRRRAAPDRPRGDHAGAGRPTATPRPDPRGARRKRPAAGQARGRTPATSTPSCSSAAAGSTGWT